jgi:hypothetical protein
VIDRNKPHDRGGWPDDSPIDRSEHALEPREKHFLAIRAALRDRDPGLIQLDSFRRAIESLPNYETLSYNARHLRAMELLLIERGLITRDELDARVEERRSATAGSEAP